MNADYLLFCVVAFHQLFSLIGRKSRRENIDIELAGPDLFISSLEAICSMANIPRSIRINLVQNYSG